MTCISLDPVFDLAKLCDASMPLFHTYPKLHKRLLEIGWKERQTSKAFGEDHTQLSDQVNHLRTYFYFVKLSKTSRKKVNQRINDWCFCKTILSCKHLRLGKAISPTGIKEKGWIKWRFIWIKEECFVIDMVVFEI